MAALVQSKDKPLKRFVGNSAPKVSSMTLEVFTHVHGNIGGFDMQDGCVASLIATNQLQERSDNDKTLQWLGGLISDKTTLPWKTEYLACLPDDARVEYLWPTAVSNLSAWSREDNGIAQTLPGSWVWQALSPNMQSLRSCVDCLIEKAMRLTKELIKKFCGHLRRSIQGF